MSHQLKKVLIVEDEPSVYKTLDNKLTEEGFDTSIAIDGIEGLKKAQTESPDLILLDIILPRMDGITMLEKLRSSQWGKNIPVVILSNLSDDKRVLAAKKNCVNDYLIKTNWSLADVIKKVKGVLLGDQNE